MRLDPILTEVDATIESQLRLADPAVADAASGFLDAFRPAMKAALVQLAEQAATEISAQLGDRRVDVHLVDGDPELVVSSTRGETPYNETDDVEARITLRLPGSLKGIIEDAATSSGDSINAWVVDAIRSNARRRTSGKRVDETFEL